VISIVVAILVAISFFRAAGKINLHRGKWVFIGLTSYYIPLILWLVVLFAFLRKPILESLWRYDSDSAYSIYAIVAGSVGVTLGFISSYATYRKYLTRNTRGAAVLLEQKFATRAVYLLATLLLSTFALYLSARYSPEVTLESSFDYTLF